MTTDSDSESPRYEWQAKDGLFHGTCTFCHKEFTHVIPRKYCPGGDCQWKANEDRRRQARLPSYAPGKTCHCLKCGHEWQRRVDQPAYCPKCLSRNWDGTRGPKEPIVCQCAICQHSWKQRTSNRPCRCPKCLSPEWDIDTIKGALYAVEQAIRLYQGDDPRIRQIRDLIPLTSIPTEIEHPNTVSSSAPAVVPSVPSAAEQEMNRIMHEMFPEKRVDPDEVIDLDALASRPPLPPESTSEPQTDDAIGLPTYEGVVEDEGLRLIREAFRKPS